MEVVSVRAPYPLHPRQDPPTLRHGLRRERSRRCTSRSVKYFAHHGH